MRNSDLGSQNQYKTPDTQEHSHMTLSTDGREFINKVEQNNEIMNYDDDDEVIEIR